MPSPVTNVPPITWNNGAPVVPSEPEVLAGRQADWTAAYGSGLNTAPTTLQGQIIESEVAIIGDANSQIALIPSMVDPDQAEGQWQDAILSIYYLQRIAAAGSVKTVTCIGAVNVTIPVGALIQDPTGYFWALTGAINLGSTGSATGTFQCTTVGPNAWPGNTPCTIYTQVNGWDQATSVLAAALGNFEETRAAAENRRRNSVAINGHGTPPTIQGLVLDVANVLSAYVIDNPAGTTENVGSTNYTLAAHSILVSVYGGLASAIAAAIWIGKDGGCAYNGNTTYTVYDTSYPVGSQPAYPVTFLIPTPTPVYFAITLQNSSLLPSNIVSLVQQAVLATFSGTDAAGSVPAGIALTISGTRYAPQINLISTAVVIESIFVGLQTAVSGEAIATANGTTATFTHTAAHLAVVPGSVQITAGSVIALDDGNGNLTGTGISTGTINYTTGAVSITYTVDPPNLTAITMAYMYCTPTTTYQAIGVDQMPTLTADSIVVKLV